MRRLLPLLPAFLLLVGCAADSDEPQAVGSTAPDFQVETLVAPASAATLAKRRGRVVLLDFWATWCGPCRQITPALEAVYARHKDQGLDAMAITDEAREIVALVEKTRPHTMPVYLDPGSKAHLAFGATSLPTILVLDRQGHIVYHTSGITDGTGDEIENAVKKALGQA